MPEGSRSLDRLARSNVFGATLITAIGGLIAVLTWQIMLLVNLATPAAAAPAFCGPTNLHTMSEPPQSQLTRDYAVLKILLLDPADRFDQIRRLYEGTLKAARHEAPAPWLAKRSERSQVLRATMPAEPGFGSLRYEAQRIDRTRDTVFARRIEAALAARNRTLLEAAFREMFLVLIDEMLSSIQQRVADSTAVIRGYQHVRRYYAVSLEAHVALQSSSNAAIAGAALEGMARLLEEAKNGGAFSPLGFDAMRRSFVRSLESAVGIDSDAPPAGPVAIPL